MPMFSATAASAVCRLPESFFLNALESLRLLCFKRFSVRADAPHARKAPHCTLAPHFLQHD